MAEATLNGRSKIELGLLAGILGVMWWGGWTAKGVEGSVAEVKDDMADVKSALKEVPTRFELQMLVKSTIGDETRDMREKIGSQDARISALEKAKDKP